MRDFPRKPLLALSALLLLAACATIGPPQPPSLELPKPPSDLRASRKGDKVVLTWTSPTLTTDRQNVRSLGPTRVCRAIGPLRDGCGAPVGEADSGSSTTESRAQKTKNTYADMLPAQLLSDNPAAFATYAVEVLNTDDRSAGVSNQVMVPLLKAFPPPPRDFTARLSSQGVTLTWTGTLLALTYPQPVIHYYRVYRRMEGSQQQILVGQVLVGTELHPSLTDESFEWEKTYYYHASTLTVVQEPGTAEARIEGDDTPEVKVFADDVFPPAVPSGLQAVFSGPGQKAFVDLVWAPVADVDLDGYNVYRHEDSTPVKVNAEPLKTPAYRDQNVVSGKRYLYSVSAIDVRGNESARSEEVGESVP
jgi:hypothetical protein